MEQLLINNLKKKKKKKTSKDNIFHFPNNKIVKGNNVDSNVNVDNSNIEYRQPGFVFFSKKS